MGFLDRPNNAVTVGIKASKYRGKLGYLIYSIGLRGHKVSVFVDDLQLAIKIKNAYRRNGWTHEQISDILRGRA